MKPKLLIVDDDPDALEMLVEWLTMEGYEPVSASNADDALRLLRQQRGAIDGVLTDYMLPDRHGLDLVRAAVAEGLVDTSRVLLLSGAPPLAEAAALGVKTVKKPIDLVALVTEIERLLHRNVKSPPPVPKTTPPVWLVLYVSKESPASLRATRTIKKRVAALPAGSVSLEIRDVAENLESAAQHRIAFTPTLVRLAPAPVMRLIGDLRNADALDDVLPPPSTD